MPWGSHVCQFYDGEEDLVKMLVPYFKQGLERNEACVWLVADLTIEELIHNHGKSFVKRGEWVHDNSKDAQKIEAVFASLAAQIHAANVRV
jgi:hypothetical protein